MLALFTAALASPAGAELAGHGAMVNSVAVSPDGKRVLTGSWDYTLKLWDLHLQKEIRTLEGHVASVNAVAFLPDGRRGVSASFDQTLKLWDLETGG
ncbi:MAG TPA: hypothetical protein VEK12_10475, partial [Alphaproteobacteria bacterium]|nr:hypothetical protein [Alphaproteobacteria bacterium]